MSAQAQKQKSWAFNYAPLKKGAARICAEANLSGRETQVYIQYVEFLNGKQRDGWTIALKDEMVAEALGLTSRVVAKARVKLEKLGLIEMRPFTYQGERVGRLYQVALRTPESVNKITQIGDYRDTDSGKKKHQSVSTDDTNQCQRMTPISVSERHQSVSTDDTNQCQKTEAAHAANAGGAVVSSDGGEGVKDMGKDMNKDISSSSFLDLLPIWARTRKRNLDDDEEMKIGGQIEKLIDWTIESWGVNEQVAVRAIAQAFVNPGVGDGKEHPAVFPTWYMKHHEGQNALKRAIRRVQKRGHMMGKDKGADKRGGDDRLAKVFATLPEDIGQIPDLMLVGMVRNRCKDKLKGISDDEILAYRQKQADPLANYEGMKQIDALLGQLAGAHGG